GKNHRLIDAVGLEAAVKLAAHYGGETILIPKENRVRLVLRNAKIVKQYDAGIGVRQIAMDFDLTERQVYSVLGSSQA
ncbi:MAG: hypothetical protein HQM01_10160, partial [Magnetococcales bacterium]|nr:hypothetical protein [Magnetococcales bacterium]